MKLMCRQTCNNAFQDLKDSNCQQIILNIVYHSIITEGKISTSHNKIEKKEFETKSKLYKINLKEFYKMKRKFHPQSRQQGKKTNHDRIISKIGRKNN